MPTLTDLDVEFVSLVDRAAVRDPVQQSEPMRFLVWKRDSHEGGSMSMTPEEQKAALDKAQADLKKAEERATAAEQQVAELTKSVDELKKAAEGGGEPEPVDKSDWPESARIAFEKAEAERQADRERAEKAEKAANEAAEIAKAEREQRVTREFVTKAETFKALPVTGADFGPVLKAASEKLEKAEYDELERVLKAADEGLAESELFKEQGRAREADRPDSAIATAKAAAAELRKSDSSLSEAEAMRKAFAADPALAARYQAETRGQ